MFCYGPPAVYGPRLKRLSVTQTGNSPIFLFSVWTFQLFCVLGTIHRTRQCLFSSRCTMVRRTGPELEHIVSRTEEISIPDSKLLAR